MILPKCAFPSTMKRQKSMRRALFLGGPNHLPRRAQLLSNEFLLCNFIRTSLYEATRPRTTLRLIVGTAKRDDVKAYPSDIQNQAEVQAMKSVLSPLSRGLTHGGTKVFGLRRTQTQGLDLVPPQGVFFPHSSGAALCLMQSDVTKDKGLAVVGFARQGKQMMVTMRTPRCFVWLPFCKSH